MSLNAYLSFARTPSPRLPLRLNLHVTMCPSRTIPQISPKVLVSRYGPTYMRPWRGGGDGRWNCARDPFATGGCVGEWEKWDTL
jgi:hypothetical protein